MRIQYMTSKSLYVTDDFLKIIVFSIDSVRSPWVSYRQVFLNLFTMATSFLNYNFSATPYNLHIYFFIYSHKI